MCRNMTAALTLAVLAWTGAGVSPHQSFAAGGTIAGMAVDPATGRAVEGAVASVPLGLEARTATTDSSGRFVLGDMPAGRGFRVFIARKGHRTATLTTDVSPEDTSRVRVELPSVYLSLSACSDHVRLVAGTDYPVRWESGGMDLAGPGHPHVARRHPHHRAGQARHQGPERGVHRHHLDMNKTLMPFELRRHSYAAPPNPRFLPPVRGE